jgi:hypothetical protein
MLFLKGSMISIFDEPDLAHDTVDAFVAKYPPCPAQDACIVAPVVRLENVDTCYALAIAERVKRRDLNGGSHHSPERAHSIAILTTDRRLSRARAPRTETESEPPRLDAAFELGARYCELVKGRRKRLEAVDCGVRKGHCEGYGRLSEFAPTSKIHSNRQD